MKRKCGDVVAAADVAETRFPSYFRFVNVHGPHGGGYCGYSLLYHYRRYSWCWEQQMHTEVGELPYYGFVGRKND